jgi:hypothetical protein
MEHAIIPDAQRHEAKGASTASANQVLKAVGDGTTSFGSVAYSELTGAPTVAGYKQIFTAGSTAASQLPTTLGTAVNVEFGAAQSYANATLSVGGTITFVNAGDYLVNAVFNVGKTNLAGDSVLLIRPVLGGTAGLPKVFKLTATNATISQDVTFAYTAAAGATLRFEMVRDSLGVNDGGLYGITPATSGWVLSPSAAITVSRYGSA